MSGRFLAPQSVRVNFKKRLRITLFLAFRHIRSHIIAGSNKNFYLVVTRAESWGYYLIRFFLPTLTGNIIGGVSPA
jgi:formate/nitrite transporter FocA (FNT family)